VNEISEQDERAYYAQMLQCLGQGYTASQILEQLGLFLERVFPHANCHKIQSPDSKTVGLVKSENSVWELHFGCEHMLELHGQQQQLNSKTRLLEKISIQMAPILHRLLQEEAAQSSLGQLQQENRRLVVESQWLQQAIELLHSFSNNLNRDHLTQEFAPLLQQLAPTGQVWLVHESIDSTAGSANRRFQQVAGSAILASDKLQKSHGLDEILNTSQTYQRPLDFGLLANTRFAELGCPCAALAISPLYFQPGALLLIWQEPQQFSAEFRKSLQLASTLLGCMLELAQMHQKTVAILEELKQSQQSLVESSRASSVAQIAAGVSHEMNNPLASIQIALESAKRLNSLPKSAAMMVDIGLVSIERCKKVAADLLRLARESSHQQVREFDLSELVESTLNLLAQSAQAKRIRLQLTKQTGTIEVCANAGEIQQALIQLLDNAMWASHELQSDQSVERLVEIEVLSLPFQALTPTGPHKENKWAAIRVRDIGCGVAEDSLESIFEPFSTTRKMADGAGLGLAIARRIGRKYSGDVWLLSPANPTVFCLAIPQA
jgi:signal transduction histidine kinase